MEFLRMISVGDWWSWRKPGEAGDEDVVEEVRCEEMELGVADDEFGELISPRSRAVNYARLLLEQTGLC